MSQNITMTRSTSSPKGVRTFGMRWGTLAVFAAYFAIMAVAHHDSIFAAGSAIYAGLAAVTVFRIHRGR
jgi:hypothetical protein